MTPALMGLYLHIFKTYPDCDRCSKGKEQNVLGEDNCGSNLDREVRGDLFEQVMFKLRSIF